METKKLTTTYQDLENIWQYFLTIEDDLSNTSRYLEPTGQENAFSFEFYKIIMLSCGEIETVLKRLCKVILEEEGIDKECGNMGEYKGTILGKIPRIGDALVIVPRWHAKNIYPFSEWTTGKLSWWEAYTALKHNRSINFCNATYRNAVFSLAGLYILILYLYRFVGFDCKGDDSKYFESNYYPKPLYDGPDKPLPVV